MNPLRVAIVSDERYPSPFADTQQVMKNAAALAQVGGLDVQLIIPRRGARRGWSDERRLAELQEFYGLPTTGHIRFAGPLRASDGVASRVALKLAYGLGAPFRVRDDGFVVLYTRDRLAAGLGLVQGLRVVFETYRALGDELPHHVRAMARLARQTAADLWVVQHSEFAARTMVREGFPAERILVAHNGFDHSDLEPRLSRAEARQRIRIQVGRDASRPLVVYTGNMQAAKGVECVVDVAARVPEVDFLLVGGQPDHVARVAGYARQVGAGNVRLTGQRPVTELAPFLYAADVLVIPPTRRALLSGRTVLPIKVFSYLAAGRAILAPRLPDTSEIFVDGHNAALVEPDDLDGCAATLRTLVANPARAQALADRALARALTLTWEARARRIKQFICAEAPLLDLQPQVDRRVA